MPVLMRLLILLLHPLWLLLHRSGRLRSGGLHLGDIHWSHKFGLMVRLSTTTR